MVQGKSLEAEEAMGAMVVVVEGAADPVATRPARE
jgi:hypothetical protein